MGLCRRVQLIYQRCILVVGLFAKRLQSVYPTAPVIKNGDIVFRVNGESINNLIGYHGETLEAVQYIVNTIVKERVPNYRKKVYLDVENYRRKRQETVEALAEKMAKKVLTTKKSIKLEPMNSFERKSIHFALSNIEHIGTHSEGTEPNRYLVIDYVD